MTLIFYLDFKLLNSFKFLLIGCCVVIFWWSFWELADFACPLHLPEMKSFLFIAWAYLIILFANAYYTFLRAVTYKLLHPYDNESCRETFNNTFVKMRLDKKKKKPLKITFLLYLMKSPMYILALGLILYWRSLFAIAYYFLDILNGFYGIDQFITLAVYIIISIISLIFTGDVNAIVICPTKPVYIIDKISSFDECFHHYIISSILHREKAEYQLKCMEKSQSTLMFFNKNVNKEKSCHEGKEKHKFENNSQIAIICNDFVMGRSVSLYSLVERQSKNTKLDIHGNEMKPLKVSEVLTIFCKYVCILHYMHIVIPFFGAVFWSSVWKLCDMVFENLGWTLTIKDLIGFIPAILFFHFINHLAILPLKDECKTRLQHVLFNTVLGITTIFKWTGIWYAYDRLVPHESKYKLSH